MKAAFIAFLAFATACSAKPPEPPPPSVLFSTFVGGDQWEQVRDVAVDDAGFLYIAGGTRSERPLPGSGPKASHDDSNDALVAKIDPSGGRVIWARTFGGPGYDQAYALELAPDGGIVVGGRGGAGFPTTPGAALREFQGGPEPKVGQWYGTQDGIVFELSPDGELRWATYLGCPEYNDFLRDIAVTPDGAVVAGTAGDGSRCPPLAEAFARGPHPSFGGGARDAVLVVLAPDGSRFEWAAHVGGSGDEWSEVTVRSDEAGNVLLLTLTAGADAPVLSAVQPKLGGALDFYVAKFSRQGAPIFATFLGGSGPEHIETHHLALAPGGDVVLAAGSQSRDYPVTEGAFQAELRGIGGPGTGFESNYPGDCVVSRISADGARLVASTYVGGSLGDSCEGVAVDGEGRVFATGGTFSSDFPTRPPVAREASSTDGFALALTPDLRRLIGSVVMGGGGPQALRTAAVSRDGRLLLAGGYTDSDGWPTRGAFSPRFGGTEDGLLVGANLLGDGGGAPAPAREGE